MEPAPSARATITEAGPERKDHGAADRAARPAPMPASSCSTRVAESTLGYNWKIGHFDPGQGRPLDRCKMALRAIHEDLRERYEMAG